MAPRINLELAWLRRTGRRLSILGRPDVVTDLHIYGGLLLATVGRWQLSRAWTLTAAGAVLFAIGFIASRPKCQPPGDNDG
jgi:hypothetical protein